jgi:hypothetical protein
MRVLFEAVVESAVCYKVDILDDTFELLCAALSRSSSGARVCFRRVAFSVRGQRKRKKKKKT